MNTDSVREDGVCVHANGLRTKPVFMPQFF
jgi:hypothetical protein